MALPARYTVEPIWKGRTAIIVASGPSFSAKQARAIAKARMDVGSDFRVIAINDAVYLAWWADWLHSCDNLWWHWNIQTVHTFRGIKTTLAEDVPAPWVTGYLQNTGLQGFDEDPSCCRTGGNSGYQAICLAMHAGAKRIVLVGFDMKAADDGQSHFFGEHPGAQPNAFKSVMLPQFETLKPALEKMEISVINATPGSALRTFPTADLERVLRDPHQSFRPS
jgi:hypothetical protein